MYFLLYLPGNYLVITLRELLLILGFYIFLKEKYLSVFTDMCTHTHIPMCQLGVKKKGEIRERRKE